MAYARIEFTEGEEPQAIVYRYTGGEPEGEARMLSALAKFLQETFARVEDGADSYLIRGGRIRAMTIHYTVRP